MVTRLAMLLTLLTITQLRAADDKASVKVTPRKATDRIELTTEEATTVISIHSPEGISGATIERVREKWPESLKLRLHLRGLENFQVRCGSLSISASVSTSDGIARLWRTDHENSPLDQKSEYWMPITSREDLKEITLPKTIFADNPKSITLQWIDFYRN